MFIKIIGKTIYGIFVTAVVALALLFLGNHVPVLGYSVKVVQSGSMEPAIHVGSIVVITPKPNYNVGDVITFGPDTQKEIPITHRIVEKHIKNGRVSFTTKGDANESSDPKEARESSVIGKVAFTLPYIGHVISFARTKLGYMVLVGLPAILIILDECADIVWEIRKYRAYKKYKAQKRREMRMQMKS